MFEPKNCAGFWLEERKGRRKKGVSNAHMHSAKEARSYPYYPESFFPVFPISS